MLFSVSLFPPVARSSPSKAATFAPALCAPTTSTTAAAGIASGIPAAHRLPTTAAAAAAFVCLCRLFQILGPFLQGSTLTCTRTYIITAGRCACSSTNPLLVHLQSCTSLLHALLTLPALPTLSSFNASPCCCTLFASFLVTPCRCFTFRPNTTCLCIIRAAAAPAAAAPAATAPAAAPATAATAAAVCRVRSPLLILYAPFFIFRLWRATRTAGSAGAVVTLGIAFAAAFGTAATLAGFNH